MADFTFSGSTLTGYTGAGGAITLPTSNGGTTITTISATAFTGKTSITSITIPSTYTMINNGSGSGAFSGCSSLVSVNASASNITRIGNTTCSYCTELTTFSFPNTLISIGIMSFFRCSKLTNVTFPDSLQTIEEFAFSAALNMTIVYVPFGTSYVETGSNRSFEAGVTVIRNSQSSVPCFTAGALILTPDGEVAVETLKAGDLVTTASGLIVPLSAVLTTRLAVTTAETAPFLIPGGTYGSAQPRDLILSPTHAFQMRRGIWMVPVKATATKSAVRQVGVGGPMTYYHLECPDYLRDNLVANGCIVESFGGHQTKKNQYTYSKRFNGYTRASSSSSSSTTHAALR